ncbi:MAG: hypothetical protein JO170_09905 [Verrucomicrobia bacterium]|nr:hypothetical protein [Verrucomicrobiota bacterium]
MASYEMPTVSINETDPDLVIHPLYDLPEKKRETDHLAPMQMTLSARISLITLRAYLILMGGMLLYHVLDLAGLFGHK